MSQTYNENLEMCVLSCILKDGSSYSLVEDLLDRKSFSWPAFGTIFQAIKDVVDSDLYPDMITVQTELERKGYLEALSIMENGLRGKEALYYIANLEGNADNLESYAHQVIEMRGLRQLVALSNAIENSIQKGKSTYEILSDIDIETGKISSYVGAKSASTRTSKDVAISNISQLENALNGESKYIMTHLAAWDDFVGGLFPRLYMVAGEQNEGKSTLVLNLLRNIAIKPPKEVTGFAKKKVKLFTFESSAEEINNKLVQMMTGISQIKIEKGELDEKELVMYKDAMKEIGNSPILYDDSSEMTLPLLRTKIRKACADGAELVIIDQLEQIMLGSSGDMQQEHIRLNYITYRIKAYQREQNVPIVLVHQRKKTDNDPRNANREPELNDLNQAGGKAPDAVVMVRTKRDPALFWVKNRQGPKGSRAIRWTGSRLLFEDIDRSESQPQFVQEPLT